ncbi:MFS transporter [Arthrobacter sp. ISL-85]|uniref:MFS transporter n=1 Tax=Arthrobacter sp. ISL-85 TaxID=2819115 RepID=UPI001BE55DE2|nr:MFS transporter [Arthrobacter sp. ISL-85]MBT2566292.1 MFS transporter [Arthrobacter sp. ISL-85]
MQVAPEVSTYRMRLRPAAAFWLQSSVLVVLMAASSAPSPLYPLYQNQWGFPPVVLTMIFAAYVLALLASLLTAGSLSDHLGRRPVLLACLGLEIVSMLVFISAGSEVPLIMARLIQGLATGSAIGALGAYLIELEAPVRAGLGTVFNGAGPAVGLAAGAVASSLVVAAAPAAISSIYVALLVLLVLQVIGTVLSPETITRTPGAAASLRPRVHFPAAVRSTAVWVLPAAVATWSLGDLILSLGPSIIRAMAGPDTAVLTGLVVAALTGTGGIATLVLGSVPAPKVLRIGMIALIAGMAATIAALTTGSVGLYFAATIIAGVGFGAGFLGVPRTLLPQAAPHERAGLLSAVYVVSYVANSVPAIAAGALISSLGLTATATGYAGMVLLLSAFVLTGQITPAQPDRK